ncbi:hypothetical protein BZA77DRAFT_128145 [Pyronema omphalodes]|nr:hypothetical protein BZA77DRAFT_128145 [Pyronema omphalodes]
MANFNNGNGRHGMTDRQHIQNTQNINNNRVFPQHNVMNVQAQSFPLYYGTPYITPPQDQFNNSFDPHESFNCSDSSQEALYSSSPYDPNLNPPQGFFAPLNQAAPAVGGSLMTPNISSQRQPQSPQDFQTANDLGQGASGRNGRKEGEVCTYCGNKRKNLKRHIESMHSETLGHLPQRYTCDEPGCNRYRGKPFRLDNLRTHKREVHGIYIPKKQRRRTRASSTNVNAGSGN